MTALEIILMVAAGLVVLGIPSVLVIWWLRNARSERLKKRARAAIYAQVGAPQHNRAMFAPPPEQPGDRRRTGVSRRSPGVDVPVHTSIDTARTGRTRFAEPGAGLARPVERAANRRSRTPGVIGTA